MKSDHRETLDQTGQPQDLAYHHEHVVALDWLLPVTMPNHPVRQITLANLALAFIGKINNWKDLGGPDAPIELYMHPQRTGVAQSVTDRIMNLDKHVISETINRVQDGNTLDLRVSRDPLALALIANNDLRFS